MPNRFPTPSPGPGSPVPWLSWKFSLLFPLAIVLLAGALIHAAMSSDAPDPVDEEDTLTSQSTGTEAAATTPRETTEIRIPEQEPSSTPAQSAQSFPREATPDLTSVTIEGAITSVNGDPIQGARITDGESLTLSGGDGLFEIAVDASRPDSLLRITASGFHDWVHPVNSHNPQMQAVLEPHQIKALYLNPTMSSSDEDIQRFIDIINTTEANAVVIDIKEEIVYYDSQVQLFIDAGSVRPIMDLAEIIQKFKDHDIYAIARLVVFKDSLVAQANPEMAVLNNVTGNLWRDDNGVAWVNPMVHKLWHANADLAVEAAGYGFDEIQYDYVRFPTDGDFSTQDFGLENTRENRQNSIEGFLELSREKLLPLGVRQSADVFGYSLVVDDDLGIGQNFARLGEYVDYLSPMIYPSHWPNGSLAVDGHPNDFPYETIAISMRRAGLKLDGDMVRVRPWLQDFSYFDMMPYGDEEVRAQIQAVEDSGASGWMLWDPNNNYHPGGLAPDPAHATPVPATPVATPVRSAPVSGRRTRPSGGTAVLEW